MKVSRVAVIIILASAAYQIKLTQSFGGGGIWYIRGKGVSAGREASPNFQALNRGHHN